MNRRVFRRFSIFALVLTPPVVEGLVLTAKDFPPYPDPVVLVCGDFTSPASFAQQVFSRAADASRSLTVRGLPRFRVVPLDDEGDASTAEFEQHFLDTLARFRVVAIISANKTVDAAYVIKLGETFRIPTLLAVATYKGLVTSKDRCTIRLVPNDGFQAAAISAWTAPYRSVLIVWNRSRYGESLSSDTAAMIEARAATQVLRVPADELLQSMCGLLEWGDFSNLNAVVYIGYHEELPDVLRAIDASFPDVPLLVSDGCYVTNLATLCRNHAGPVYLSFPVDPSVETDAEQSGFGVFGADACLLIANALQALGESGGGREDLSDALREVAAPQSGALRSLSNAYRFERNENTALSFQVVPIRPNQTRPAR